MMAPSAQDNKLKFTKQTSTKDYPPFNKPGARLALPLIGEMTSGPLMDDVWGTVGGSCGTRVILTRQKESLL